MDLLGKYPTVSPVGAPKNECATKRERNSGFQKTAERLIGIGRPNERLCCVDRLSRQSIATSAPTPTKVLA